MSDKDKSPAVVIEITDNGPLIVKDLPELQNTRGENIPMAKNVIALCRCGQSANKPFCDGTHAKIDFSGKRESNKPLHREKAYTGKKITIHDNRTICCHAGACVAELSSVFSRTNRPWIDPDGDTPAAVIDLIRKCPSGALSYSIDGEHQRDFDRPAVIQAAKDGPYHVRGGIAIETGDEDLQPPSREHYALCRCGVSKNKPYCDGSHTDINFQAE